MKVSIRDYQIIKKMDLEFVPGLTTIVGESNNGKSSIFKAIKSCIFNVPGTTPIRQGTTAYLVGIEDNDNKVIFKKGTKSTMYMINKQKYERPGSSQVEEVADALNIRTLNINGKNEQINFWEQMNLPFLLDRSPAELYKFIAGSGEEENIIKVFKLIQGDIKELKTKLVATESEINLLKNQNKDYEKELESLEQYNLEGLKLRFKEFLDKYSEISKALKIISRIEEIDHIQANLISKISTNNKILSCLIDIDGYALKYNTNASYISRINSILTDTTRCKNKIVKNKEVLDNINSIKIKYNNYLKLKEYITLSNNIITTNSNLCDNREVLDNINNRIDEIGICPTCGKSLKEGH